MKHFPNGFASWQETHYEIVQAITIIRTSSEPHQLLNSIVYERHEAEGHGGLYELAEELTDAFEREHEGFLWDGNTLPYFETLENWLDEKLK
jgi:hypothetical protein